MSKNFKHLVEAVELRGCTVKRLDYYVWALNGKPLMFDEFIKACRGIISKYSTRLDLTAKLYHGGC